MTGFIALLVSVLVGWLVHALIGAHVSLATDFFAGMLVSGVAYIAVWYWLKKLRGGY